MLEQAVVAVQGSSLLVGWPGNNVWLILRVLQGSRCLGGCRGWAERLPGEEGAGWASSWWTSHFPGEGGGLLENDVRALDFEGTCVRVAILVSGAGRCARGAWQEQPWMRED